MSIKTLLTITPVGKAAAALTQAHLKQQPHMRGGSADGKPRRTHGEWVIPGTRSTLDITRIEPSAKNPHAVYCCEFSPTDCLVGPQAFSAGVQIAHVVPVQFALFKVALQAMTPEIPDSALAEITLEHCKVDSLTQPYYFELSNPTEAYRVWLQWLQHLKVVLDGPHSLPARTNSWKEPPVRVAIDMDCRDAFSAMLSFGQARFSLKRDPGHAPTDKSDLQSVDERKEMLAHMRRILCIELTVDLAKFQYTDDIGLDLQLPTDCRMWTPAKLPEDPAKTIWDRFRWECWLEANLLNEMSSLPGADGQEPPAMPWQLQEVMQAYLAGEPLRHHQHIGGDHKKFVKYREALITKAQLDILNPWSVAQLNLGQALSPLFGFKDRFLPQMHQLFTPHTLPTQAIGAAILKLDAAMSEQSAWDFDTSAYLAAGE